MGSKEVHVVMAIEEAISLEEPMKRLKAVSNVNFVINLDILRIDAL